MELGIKLEDSREPIVHASEAAPVAVPGDDKLEAIVKAVLERMGTGAEPQSCPPCAVPKVYGSHPGQLKFAKYPRDFEMPTIELRNPAGVLITSRRST